VQCANVADTNYLTGDKQVPSAPAKLYHAACSGRPSHIILMSILVSRMALTFTMHAAGNELILFYRYRGTTIVFLLLPPNYHRNLPIYHGNRGITAFPITVSLSSLAQSPGRKRVFLSWKSIFSFTAQICIFLGLWGCMCSRAGYAYGSYNERNKVIGDLDCATRVSIRYVFSTATCG